MMAMRPKHTAVVTGLIVGALVLSACAEDAGEPAEEAAGEDVQEAAGTELQADVGVDVDAQVVRLGALNDESGPAAPIAIPWAVGRRVLVQQVNAGEIDLLPEGWTLELVERDHGYNPQEAVQAFHEISDDVLFFITNFGTPNTLPLVDDMQDQNVVVFPASYEESFFEIEYTPPLGPPYSVEAHQALDWAIEDAGGTDLRFAIVYQADDFGRNVLDALQDAADFHGVELVEEIEVRPGEADFTAVVSTLQRAEAEYVLLTALPGESGGVMGTALQAGYEPTWVSNTPGWIDDFFDPDVLPPAAYRDFHWVTGGPMWNDDLPGMDGFLEAYERYGADIAAPSYPLLYSYANAYAAVEALGDAIEAGDVTRDGFLEAMRRLETDANGLTPAGLDLTTFPYDPTTDTRILSPGEDITDWRVERDFSTPESWTAGS